MSPAITATAKCYRLFDVADEIDLEQVRRLVAASRRLSLRGEGSAFVRLSNPPLAFDVGQRTLALAQGSVPVHVSARVFDHGAVSVCLTVSLPPHAAIESLVPLADELYDAPAVELLAREELKGLATILQPSFKRPHAWAQNEAYTVLVATELNGATPAELVRQPALARLLLGEAKEQHLSAAEVAEVLDRHHSYTDHDLVVVEWNAAFLYDPAGGDDIIDLLEVANAQLLELRYYDEVLDQELARVYDAIELRKGNNVLLSPYRALSRELLLTVIELSEFIERIENGLKIVGDVYLARVYEEAVGQLRIRQWTEQVTRKHRLLQQTYALLKGEVDHDRTLILEVMVVGLILLEIVLAATRLGH